MSSADEIFETPGKVDRDPKDDQHFKLTDAEHGGILPAERRGRNWRRAL
jgi:hypothetical protein